MAKRHTLTLIAATLLSACSLAPEYRVPDAPVAAQYRNIGPWVAAQPADRIARDGWWTVYADDRLNGLQQELVRNNADLRAAWDHYRQAQAYVTQARSAELPTLSLQAIPQRDRQSANRPLRNAGPDDYNSVTLSGQLQYEVDLWGRVRDTVAAARFDAQAEQADLASVRLSLQAELADNYFRLCGLDLQTQLLDETIQAYARALELTETLHDHGVVSGLDVTRAQTQLHDAKSQKSQVAAQRALLEHAIAVLVGASPSEFALPQATALMDPPAVPVGVPSALLQRRPDVAAAERRAAESNSKIGVARAAYYPSITLSAQGGVQSTEYGNLLSAPNFFWALGPQLVQYLFDGGLRRARLDAARAAADESGAKYRSVVLKAFRQVEDNLALLGRLGDAADQQRAAAGSASRAVDLSLRAYRQGASGYLDVIESQTAALSARRSLLDLQTRRLAASVDLIQAVGGGWSSEQLASSPPLN
jgi:NodT family efflux transporter outer membrane factor (OMF) lipoprotein